MTWLNPRFRLADAAGSTSESEEPSWICWSVEGVQPGAAHVAGDPVQEAMKVYIFRGRSLGTGVS